MPVQPLPLQPANTEPASGTGVNVMVVPMSMEALHGAGDRHSSSPGLPETTPAPVPANITERDWRDANATVAFVLPSSFTVQVELDAGVVAQAPPQLSRNDPCAGLAVRVTDVPTAKLALQTPPQSIPAGLLTTVPPPPPCFATLSVRRSVKRGLIVTVGSVAASSNPQVPPAGLEDADPGQVPCQPPKTELLTEEATRRIDSVPEATEYWQVKNEPQIPSCQHEMMPGPPTSLCPVRVAEAGAVRSDDDAAGAGGCDRRSPGGKENYQQGKVRSTVHPAFPRDARGEAALSRWAPGCPGTHG